MILEKTSARLTPEASKTFEDLKRKHISVAVVLYSTKNNVFQVLIRETPGKKPRYVGVLHPDGTFKEKHSIPPSQKIASLSSEASIAYEQLVKLHGEVTLLSKPNGKFRIILCGADGVTRYLGILYSDGTFKEKHRKSTKQKILESSSEIKMAYENLKTLHGEVILTPNNHGKFTVRTPGNSSGHAKHLGMLYPDGTFRKRHIISARERSQGLPSVMRSAYENLKERCGNVTLIDHAGRGIQVQKYDSIKRTMRFMGTILPDGTFKPSRVAGIPESPVLDGETDV